MPRPIIARYVILERPDGTSVYELQKARPAPPPKPCRRVRFGAKQQEQRLSDHHRRVRRRRQTPRRLDVSVAAPTATQPTEYADMLGF